MGWNGDESIGGVVDLPYGSESSAGRLMAVAYQTSSGPCFLLLSPAGCDVLRDVPTAARHARTDGVVRSRVRSVTVGGAVFSEDNVTTVVDDLGGIPAI